MFDLSILNRFTNFLEINDTWHHCKWFLKFWFSKFIIMPSMVVWFFLLKLNFVCSVRIKLVWQCTCMFVCDNLFKHVVNFLDFSSKTLFANTFEMQGYLGGIQRVHVTAQPLLKSILHNMNEGCFFCVIILWVQFWQIAITPSKSCNFKDRVYCNRFKNFISSFQQVGNYQLWMFNLSP